MALESVHGCLSGKCLLTSNCYHLHSRQCLIYFCNVSKQIYRCSRLGCASPMHKRKRQFVIFSNFFSNFFFELFSYFHHYAIFRNRVIWTFLSNFYSTFFELFLNFFWTFVWTFFIFFFERPPSHPLDSPPTICKLCTINNYNICFELFFELPPSPPSLPFNHLLLRPNIII
jgi:hypothetical protein